MRTKLDVLLRTDLNPQECLRRLQEASDPGKRTLFSLSGYKGSKPVLAKIEGSEIKLWKRRYYRNDFAPYFFGALSTADRGTRIEGHFDMDRWVRIFMTIWLTFAIIGGAAALIATVPHPIHGDAWIGVIVPLGLVLFGIFLPKFGRWIGKGEEAFLKEFLEQTLSARPDDRQTFSSSGRTIENTPL
jgi:hypothetical protein